MSKYIVVDVEAGGPVPGPYSMAPFGAVIVDNQLSPRIVNNKGDEYITFKNVPSSDLEVMTMGGGWQPLDSWNVIFDEPLNA